MLTTLLGPLADAPATAAPPRSAPPGARAPSSSALATREAVGRFLYFDASLSRHGNQSCGSCHAPSAGWADPANAQAPHHQVVSLGSDGTSLGGRQAPSAAYAAFSPPFRRQVHDDGSSSYQGGQFWDGRASTLREQAKGPFLNPKEMGMADPAAVVEALRQAPYAPLFREVYPSVRLEDPAAAFEAVADAIAAFEAGRAIPRFTSRYDRFLRGEAALSPTERRGLALFEGKAGCSFCHPSSPGDDGSPPLFTDFTYENLGIPRSTHAQLAGNPTDYGLGARASVAAVDPTRVRDPVTGATVVVSAGQAGKFKVPTLRNVARTAPYGHNGYFATLEAVVDFYNTASAASWPRPEVERNVNRTDLGDLRLRKDEVRALVAFLHTLTDEG